MGGRGAAGKAASPLTPGILAAIDTITSCNSEFVGSWDEQGRLEGGARTFRNGDSIRCREPPALCRHRCCPGRGGESGGTGALAAWFALSGLYKFVDALAGDAFGNGGKPLRKRARTTRMGQRRSVEPNRRCEWFRRLDAHAMALVVFTAGVVAALVFAAMAAWGLVGVGSAESDTTAGFILWVGGGTLLTGAGMASLLSPVRRSVEGWGGGSWWQISPVGLVTDAWTMVFHSKLYNLEVSALCVVFCRSPALLPAVVVKGVAPSHVRMFASTTMCTAKVDIRWDRPVSRMWYVPLSPSPPPPMCPG